MCARLVDNKLQTMLPEIEEVVTDGRDDDFLNTNASFGEYALIPDQDSPLPRKLCNVQIKTLLGYFNVSFHNFGISNNTAFLVRRQ